MSKHETIMTVPKLKKKQVEVLTETENHGIRRSKPVPTAFKPVTVFDRDLTVTGANSEKR
jgi:hypothetical protein